MSLFMGKDCCDFGVGECGQCVFVDYNLVMYIGQIVGKGLCDV